MPTPGDFATDCAGCPAYCCTAFAFDRGPAFGHDKPADSPCRHLQANHRCAIHARLDTDGYTGCARYDCDGAGPHVLAIFGGAFPEGPADLARMGAAFRTMCEVHRLWSALGATGTLPIGDTHAAHLHALRDSLAPADGWTADLLAAFEAAGTATKIRAYLRQLAPVLRQAEHDG